MQQKAITTIFPQVNTCMTRSKKWWNHLLLSIRKPKVHGKCWQCTNHHLNQMFSWSSNNQKHMIHTWAMKNSFRASKPSEPTKVLDFWLKLHISQNLTSLGTTRHTYNVRKNNNILQKNKFFLKEIIQSFEILFRHIFIYLFIYLFLTIKPSQLINYLIYMCWSPLPYFGWSITFICWFGSICVIWSNNVT